MKSSTYLYLGVLLASFACGLSGKPMIESLCFINATGLMVYSIVHAIEKNKEGDPS